MPLTTIRPLLRTAEAPRRLWQASQRRGAQVVVHRDQRFFQTAVEPQVLARYREKLEKKQQSEGVSSFEELKEVYKDKIRAARTAAAVPEVDAVLDAPLRHKHAPFNPPPAPTPAPTPSPSPSSSSSPHFPLQMANARARKAPSSSPTPSPPPGVKTLASFVDVEKLAVHSDAKEIELIWRARFVDDAQSLCAVLPAESYARMAAVAQRHPMFVLPLPRGGGGEGECAGGGVVELHLLQWTFPTADSSTVLFTSLEEYKLHGEFAVPHTTLTHHCELAGREGKAGDRGKGLVLAQGQVVPDRGVSVAQAQWLVVALQRFYGVQQGPDAARRQRMLALFSSGDSTFSVDGLIAEVEKAE